MVIRKRGDKYYFILSVRDENGQPKRIERVGGNTKAAARKAGELFLAQQVDYYGRFSDVTKITYSQLWENFLSEYAEIYLKPATVRTYRQIGKNHILPKLGKTNLQMLTYRALQNFIIKKHKEVSHGTAELILAVLKKSLGYAVSSGQLHGNFWSLLKLPRQTAPAEKAHVFSQQEIDDLMAKFPAGHPIHMPMILSYYTGMRVGECLALRWRDIDEVNGTIQITSTLYDNLGKGQRQDSAKTATSTRSVPVVPELKAELKDYQHMQKLIFFQMGKRWNISAPICTTADARQATSYTIRYFNMYCRDKFGAGSFHSLRHTHATKLLEAGIPIEEVSKHLGHSNVLTTSKIYSHYTKKRQANIASAIEQIM